MDKILRYCVIILFWGVICSCIDNDVPFPHTLGRITAFEVEGQMGDAVIDSTKYTVTVEISDTVDIANVRLLRMEVTDNATYTPELTQYLDLSTPIAYTLTTYPNQNYIWSIIANQTIERYLHADNQVGEAEFNVQEHSAVFYVSDNLTNVQINDIQLGPSNSTISPDPTTLHDFSTRQTVTVSYRDVSENWTINAYIKEVQVLTNDADAWAYHAYLSGTYATSLQNPTFMYKKSSDSDWTTFPSASIIKNGSAFSATVTGLNPGTDYVFKAVAGDDISGEEKSFTTETAVQMPNMSFDEWTSETISGKQTWFPDADINENFWWDSGNQGANALGEANPTSPEETFVISGKASRMETISVLGQMAGGNVFAGAFVKTIIGAKVGAQVNFGRPFTTRPSKLHGYYSYEPQTINKTKTPYKGLEGRPDRCHIFLMLFDSDKPYFVDTSEGIYLPPFSDDCVIGYADLVDSTSTGGVYKEFTIPVVYKDDRKPGYCAVVAVASYYADYFTGGVGTLMYADEFNFIYDSDITWE